MENITVCTHSIVRDAEGKIMLYDNNKIVVSNKSTGELLALPLDPALVTIYGVGIYEEAENEMANQSKQTKSVSLESQSQHALLPHSSMKKNVWSRNSILRLIFYYKKYEEKFKSTSVRNDSVYNMLAEELSGEGYNFTGLQCRDKWKYLKLKYMKKLDNMKTTSSGAAAIHFEFFDEFNEIFGKKPNAVPIAIASSRKGITPDVEPENDVENVPQISKKKKTETREETIERRHKERLERQDKVIQLFERFVSAVEKQ